MSEQEYENVLIQAFVRGAAGAYNMMKEAQVLHPLCTRCLTLLEVLAQERGQQLPPGTALQPITSFAGFNALAVQNDPLISY